MRQATRIIVLGLFILLGCEELEQPATNQFVVEAFITAGEPIELFYRDFIEQGCQTGRNTSNALEVTFVP